MFQNDPHLEFQRLRTEAPMCWDGNLAAHGAHVDPETFATEWYRVESARLHLDHNLGDVVDRLAERLGSPPPLFLQPVDDFDMAPARVVDLLRLLRMLSFRVPRVVFLILGSIESAEEIMRLHYGAELANVAGKAIQEGFTPLVPSLVASRAGEIAMQSLRKSVPPAQRFLLDHMTLLEALSFRPHYHAEGPELVALLDRLPMILRLPKSPGKGPAGAVSFVGRPLSSLGDFLLLPSLATWAMTGKDLSREPGLSTRERLERATGVHGYQGTGALVGSIRQVLDLHQGLDKILAAHSAGTDETPAAEFSRLVDMVATGFREALGEDPSQVPSHRQILHRAITSLTTGMLSLDNEKILSGLTAGRGHRCLLAHGSFTAQKTVKHYFEPAGTNPKDPDQKVSLPGSVALEERAANWLLLLHDLLLLGENHGTIGGDLAPGANNLLAKFDWPDPVLSVNWHLCPWDTFLEFDLFSSAWNRAVDRVREERPRVAPEDRFAYLLFVWLSGGYAVSSGQEPIRWSGRLPPTSEDWSAFWRTKGIGDSDRLRMWLQASLITLAPECGTPKELAKFAEGILTRLPKDRKLMERVAPSVARIRERRFSAMVESGLDSPWAMAAQVFGLPSGTPTIEDVRGWIGQACKAVTTATNNQEQGVREKQKEGEKEDIALQEHLLDRLKYLEERWIALKTLTDQTQPGSWPATGVGNLVEDTEKTGLIKAEEAMPSRQLLTFLNSYSLSRWCSVWDPAFDPFKDHPLNEAPYLPATVHERIDRWLRGEGPVADEAEKLRGFLERMGRRKAEGPEAE